MGTFRLYTGADGQSHVETIDLAKTSDWTAGLATTNITFRSQPPGRFQDWHPAPRRQFVIILSGQLEIGLGDGSKHIFGPGDARLVGRYNRQGSHDCHTRESALCDRDDPTGEPVKQTGRGREGERGRGNNSSRSISRSL